MPQFTKKMVWELFEADAKSFALFCHKGLYEIDETVDDDQKALAFIFSQYDSVSLGSHILSSYALPVLLAKGVISQATAERISAAIS
ncbi:MAG: hypothetical protein HQL75_00280 [Magnetococcales bacterium]|nr:hypothetical protein [Magnetococcales bacterium]